MRMEKKGAIVAVLADAGGEREPMPTIGIISVVVFTYSCPMAYWD
jgi:hypothetical protein